VLPLYGNAYIIMSIFNILLIIVHIHTANPPHPLPAGRVLNVLYEPMKIIENIIIFLTYAAETNKQRLDQLKSALQLVKTLSDEEEEEEEEGSQTSKERRTATKLNMPLLDMSDKRWCISTVR
jgi:hypothetical protein